MVLFQQEGGGRLPVDGAADAEEAVDAVEALVEVDNCGPSPDMATALTARRLPVDFGSEGEVVKIVHQHCLKTKLATP
jgi:hypothetical protein